MKKLKLKGLVVLGALSMVMGTALGVSLKSEEKFEVAKADFSFNTYQGVFLFRKYPNLGWNSAGAKTAVKFKDNYGHECWSQIIEENDIFKGGYDSDWKQNYVDYFVYPDNFDHEWTKFQLHRIDSSATSEPWNHVWNYAKVWDINSGLNCYGASKAENDTNDIRYLSVDVNSATLNEGETIYIRDTNDDQWTAANHYLQIHLWGNSHMQGDRYINATKVEGSFNDAYTDVIGHFYEAVIPSGAGRYKWFQVKRINPSTSTPSNQSADHEVDRSKNVFEYNGNGWDGGVMNGSFKWNFTDRTNAFARYLLNQTSGNGKCDGNNTSGDHSTALSTPWTNIKNQFQQMAPSFQSSFAGASSEGSSVLNQAAKRYDYIAYKYQSGCATPLTNFAGRSIPAKAAQGRILPIVNDTNNGVVTILAASIITLIGFGSFFFLRKKKIHN